jgi:hypothetical protein
MILLEKEFNFFIRNQEKLVKKYKGKHIAIKGNKILGEYNSLSEAVKETAKHEKLGTFLIQKCESSKKAYTQTYHSRAKFA